MRRDMCIKKLDGTNSTSSNTTPALNVTKAGTPKGSMSLWLNSSDMGDSVVLNQSGPTYCYDKDPCVSVT